MPTDPTQIAIRLDAAQADRLDAYATVAAPGTSRPLVVRQLMLLALAEWERSQLQANATSRPGPP